jgi:hypothetical protein
MLNVQTLGILLRALRDGNTYPEAPRAPAAVSGVARTPAVAADPNESLRGDAAVRALPALLRSAARLVDVDREPVSDGSPRARSERAPDPRAAGERFVPSPADTRALSHESRVVSHDLAEARITSREARVAPNEPRAAGALASTVPPARLVENVNATASAALEISPTGRWLAEVPQRVSQTDGAVVRLQSPLVARAEVGVPALATALENTVATSGVFYEAHLARWIADDLPLAQLSREPQSSWKSTPMPDGSSVPPLPHDADKLAILARQLETLDTRTIAWSGSLWPGQHATIEIAEEERGRSRDATDDAGNDPAWRTRITLTLPMLGTVEAALALRGDAIEVRFVAGEATQSRLESARDALRTALAARSLELTAFSTGTADGR